MYIYKRRTATNNTALHIHEHNPSLKISTACFESYNDYNNK